MIGTNSLIKNLIIANVSNARNPFEVIVQANKNYGICDILLPNKLVEPEKPAIATKETNTAYKEAKLLYDCRMRELNAKRSLLLNEFQGRQLNDESVRIHLSNVLYSVLN